MNNTLFSVLIYGAIASMAASFVGGLTTDGQCAIVYAAMILGALMSIARILEKRL